MKKPLLRETDEGILLSVRVQPRSKKDSIEGVKEGSLKIRLTAPPIDDKANEALVALLAHELGIPKKNVTIENGSKSRDKSVLIVGSSLDEIQKLLS